jgi:myo-inositol-1-phosphate synthase
MANKKVRLAIIGVGNCASLVQGVQYYKEAADDGAPSLLS